MRRVETRHHAAVGEGAGAMRSSVGRARDAAIIVSSRRRWRLANGAWADDHRDWGWRWRWEGGRPPDGAPAVSRARADRHHRHGRRVSVKRGRRQHGPVPGGMRAKPAAAATPTLCIAWLWPRRSPVAACAALEPVRRGGCGAGACRTGRTSAGPRKGESEVGIAAALPCAPVHVPFRVGGQPRRLDGRGGGARPPQRGAQSVETEPS